MPKKQPIQSIPAVKTENLEIIEIERAISDFEITSSILGKLKMSEEVPIHNISVSTNKGQVTMSGNFQWHYQKGIAADIVGSIIGVKEFNNYISVNPQLTLSSLEVAFSVN